MSTTTVHGGTWLQRLAARIEYMLIVRRIRGSLPPGWSVRMDAEICIDPETCTREGCAGAMVIRVDV